MLGNAIDQAAIARLFDELDRPAEGTGEFLVIPVHHVDATAHR